MLIVDEAHNLDWDVLEEIRLLGNLENRRGKMLQILLAGQPELDRKLEAPRCSVKAENRLAMRTATVSIGRNVRIRTVTPISRRFKGAVCLSCRYSP